MTTDVNADQHPSTLAAIRDLVVLERHTIDDTNTAALFDGDDEFVIAFVVNEDSNETASITVDGDGDNVRVVGRAYGNSQGSGSDNNVYHDGSDYVIENQNGSTQDYTVVGLAVV
jgi:hypothetical protein